MALSHTYYYNPPGSPAKTINLLQGKICRGWTLDFGNSKIWHRHYELGVTQLQTPLGTSKPPPNLVNEYIAEFPTTVSWGTEERNKTKEQERKKKKRDDGNGKKGKGEDRQVTQSRWAFGYAGGGAGIEGTSIR